MRQNGRLNLGVKYFRSNYYYLFYLLPDSVPFLGLYRLIPSIYRKNP